ncbi:MAG: TonB-dependent receptor [Candidatus Electryonea clarkiae]|nr:TonB-dependent receptor [Candidatus Electryonea clarkiae]MDP8287708.1 TonB-dependent receptor [Candidatus Electryonea clarkiae]
MKPKLKNLLTVIFLIFASSLHAAGISGYVADHETGETIIAVNVVAERFRKGASTDLDGFFVVSGLPKQNIVLVFSHLGYEQTSQTVDLNKGDVFLGTVHLQPAAIQSEAVEIRVKREEIIDKDLDIASFEIDPIVLTEVPQFNQDVFQLVKLSPSVTVSDPFSPQYYVRGSDPSENMVQLDGMTIYNPHHLISLQAVFNPYAIKNIEMLVGGFSAEYGGRNASILSITSREGHKEEFKGEFSANTSGFVGATEFPIAGGGTAMISSRFMTSLLSRVLLNMPNYMGDFNAASRFNIGKTKLLMSTFYARDYMDYDIGRLSIYIDEDSGLRDFSAGFLTSTNNYAGGIKTRSVLSPSLILESHVYYSGFDVDNKTFLSLEIEDDDNEDNVDIALDYKTGIYNKISDMTTKSDLVYYAPLNQELNIGAEQNYYQFENKTGLSYDKDLSSKSNSTLQSYFIQDKVKLGNVLLKAGYRSARFTPENKWRIEPRASLAIRISKLTFKAAWGEYCQYLTAMNTQDYEFSQFVDYYYPLSNRNPLKSTHYITGVEGNINENLDFSLSGYYKELNDCYRFDYNNSLQSIYGLNAALEQGSGEAWGAELLFKGKTGRLSGWTGYSYSRSTRSFPSILNGKDYLFDGDQTHSFKAVLLYSLTRDITASTILQLTSGFPRTWETGYMSKYSYYPLYNDYASYPVTITAEKNNVRFPRRVLLDLGYKKRLREGFGANLAEFFGSPEAYFTMKVQNVLFLRRNPIFYMYIPDIGHYGFDVEWVPIVSVGYNIKF